MVKKKLTRESETLFIPLIGKAEVHKYGDLLHDEKARAIVENVDYDFSQINKSRFLTIYMGIRAAVLDDIVTKFIEAHENAFVVTLGCGLDARCLRVKGNFAHWYDLDLPDVIEVRKEYYEENEHYHMIASSVLDFTWLDQIQADADSYGIIIAEGLTMYLSAEENRDLILAFKKKFKHVDYAFDGYSTSAVWWSKYKNPVNKMGAVIRWGLDDAGVIEKIAEGIRCKEIKSFRDRYYSDKLSGLTKWVFRLLYANRWADKLYRIYNFQINE